MESKDIHSVQYHQHQPIPIPNQMPVLPNLPHLSIPSTQPHNTEYGMTDQYREHYKEINVNPYSYPSPRISPQFNLHSHTQPPLPPQLNSQFLPLPYNIPPPADQHMAHFTHISPMASPRSMSMPIPINHPMTVPTHSSHPLPMSAFKYPHSTCSNVQIYDINPPNININHNGSDIMSESASTNSSNSSHSYSNNNEDISMLPPGIPPPPTSNVHTDNPLYSEFPSEYPDTNPTVTDHTLFDDIATKIKEDIDASFIPPHTMDGPPSSFSDFDDTFIDTKPDLMDIPTDTTNSTTHSNQFEVTRTVSSSTPPNTKRSRRKKVCVKVDSDSDDQNETKKTKKRAKSKSKSNSSSTSSTGSTKKKIHICPAPDCHKEFKYKSHLERHMASHSKSKPFKCPTCKKCFGHQYYLQDHIRYNHIKDGSVDRKHICSICHKTFRLKINLTNHYRIHTGEKPFKCKNCNKAFTQKGNCDAHYRACIGIKPFKCTTCNKTFTRKMYLQQHERTHTGVKPFKCTICNKAFAIKSNMVKHKRARHKDQL